ncbi:uncharacterized protein CCOS01_08101 [Colletotrichum costaricense]|uniref:PRISE-like Rossmann-fold domain-containing protein n=1 Tax=Colletotrichum costaricense TaxID=1209916 RepID=A0AAJ0DZB9_9PEZI|nr:uncharacterized protein CCOS01_08101 [Colletotrichum costaricense]KAK1525683.1 hypothetical protein CCOS01_08101 [Colletotrichum costaricense]
MSKRPMGRKTARLEDDPRLKIHTGLDLTDADLTLQRPKAIPEVVVLHLYVTAYTGHESDLENPVKINAAIIDNGLAAVKHLCPNLEIVSLQTGGKETHERPLNIEDGDSVSWEMKWRSICSYFGLNGIGPPEQLTSQTFGINCLIARKDK